jgi:hypothetical protein
MAGKEELTASEVRAITAPGSAMVFIVDVQGNQSRRRLRAVTPAAKCQTRVSGPRPRNAAGPGPGAQRGPGTGDL